MIQEERNLLNELNNDVQLWVSKTFNYIQLEVVEKFCDNNLFDYIVNPSVDDSVLDWMGEKNEEELIVEFSDSENKNLNIQDYISLDDTIKSSFCKAYGDDIWIEFCDFLAQTYENDIYDFINEQEVYPLWNTLFEFRDSIYNQPKDVEKCISVGLGVIEGLEPFNNIVYMTSAGHSFFSDYWIPLYLSIFDNDREKYKSVDYSSL